MTRPSAEELRSLLGLDPFIELFMGRDAAAFQSAIHRGVDQMLRHGTFDTWWAAIKELTTVPVSIDLDRDAPQSVGGVHADHSAALARLGPWKKGPFELGSHFLDAEWRSDLKWRRLTQHLATLENETVLDVGTGNGYLLLRALGAGARRVLGIEPSVQYVMQYLATSKFFPHLPRGMAPMTCDEFVPGCRAFDTVLSLGVLYHRKSPIDHLEQLRGFARPGGRVVVETITVEGPDGYCLLPQGRYAGMRNVWFLPSVGTLMSWFSKLGFVNIQGDDPVPTTAAEQRSTAWCGPVSLADALDPDERSRTVEGHPAPQRVIVSARVPG